MLAEQLTLALNYSGELVSKLVTPLDVEMETIRCDLP
jgi:hypothetical protein